MSGHLGIARTCERIRTNFYWPGLQGDVARYCKSCDVCQRSVPKVRVRKAPLQKMPIIGTPFQKLSMDLIGPISSVSERGNQFVLTVVDYTTRYPEAIALPSIETERVAETLVQIYSRVGVPQEILTPRHYTTTPLPVLCSITCFINLPPCFVQPQINLTITSLYKTTQIYKFVTVKPLTHTRKS